MAWPVLLLARELDLGGSERQMTEIAKTLDRSRFSPHVGCFRPHGMRAAELAAAGVPIAHFPVYSFASPRVLAEARSLAAYIRRHGIRLVHTFDYPLTLFAVPVARWLTDTVVLSSQRSHRSLIPRGRRRLICATDRLVDAVVVNCDFLRQHLRNNCCVPANRIRVCYNGVDLDRFQRPTYLAPRKDEVTIGAVCALRPEKDLETLIEAFARIQQPGLNLTIVGSGPMLCHLRSLAEARGLDADRVFVPATADVAAHLNHIDIFVLPSTSEAFSNSLLEAMACGCCPVVSRVGGNTELIRHGENGIVFAAGAVDELSQALLKLSRDRVTRRQLARNARSTAEQFSMPRSAHVMELIYADLIRAAESSR